jgi:hypothetical protein
MSDFWDTDTQPEPRVDGEIDNKVEGVINPFIHRKATRNTRAVIEKYLEETMPGQWDEWNVRMTKIEWDREDRIARSLES